MCTYMDYKFLLVLSLILIDYIIITKVLSYGKEISYLHWFKSSYLANDT